MITYGEFNIKIFITNLLVLDYLFHLIIKLFNILK
jgi:hypothetical protein